MREAVGGSMLFYILIPVLFILLAFMVFIMRYASVYRASNYIISQIETCEAMLDDCDHSSIDDIDDELRNRYYYSPGIYGVTFDCTENSKGTIYSVTLPVKFELPLIGEAVYFTVKSESKTIYSAPECVDFGL